MAAGESSRLIDECGMAGSLARFARSGGGSKLTAEVSGHYCKRDQHLGAGHVASLKQASLNFISPEASLRAQLGESFARDGKFWVQVFETDILTAKSQQGDLEDVLIRIVGEE